MSNEKDCSQHEGFEPSCFFYSPLPTIKVGADVANFLLTNNNGPKN